MFDKVMGLIRADLAMDLGTANTLVCVKGQGVVLNEPSVVALSKKSGKLLAIGSRAKAMYGKTPGEFTTVRPMKDGVIADFDSTKKMIAYFIQAVRPHRFAMSPHIVIGVPSGITQVEKRAVIESALAAGVRQVNLIEEPMAAAIGARMPVAESVGNLVVDIGGGTTEVAIISMYATAYSASTRVAGDEIDEALMRFVRTDRNLDIGVFEAERVKMTIGSAFPLEKRIKMKVYGRDLVSGLPKHIELVDSEVREAIEEPVKSICDAVRRAMEGTTPEMAEDISRRGIVLAGGGSLLKGLAARLGHELGVTVYRAKNPLTAVARGALTVLEDWETYRRVVIT